MLACLHCGRELSPRGRGLPPCGEPGPAAPPRSTAGAGPAPARAGIIIGWVGFGVVLLTILFGFAVLGVLSSAGSDLPVRFAPTPS